MKKITGALVVSTLIFSAVAVLQSCKKDDDNNNNNNNPPISEFIADDNSFKSFDTWKLAATKFGPDPGIDSAHLGKDTSTTRDIYIKDDQSATAGKYPVGTMIVKHSYNFGKITNVYTAMVKRGNNFNPANNDWEWFLLNKDGTIADDGNGNKLRGASLMAGACGACHSKAATDYVFSK